MSDMWIIYDDDGNILDKYVDDMAETEDDAILLYVNDHLHAKRETE